MRKSIVLLLVPVFLSFTSNAQLKKDSLSINDDLIQNSADINEMIKLKEGNQNQIKLLKEFKKQYGDTHRMTVSEFKDHYEIIVSHPNSNEYTGGAECYRLNKKTGITEMIWHEHPMEIPDINKEEDEGTEKRS